MKNKIALISLTVFLALSGAFDYTTNHMIQCDCPHVSVEMASNIIDGTAGQPFAYRILTPYLLLWLGGNGLALFIFHFIGRVLLFNLVYAWIRHWKGSGYLAICVLHIAISMTYQTWYNSDYALTEAVLLTLAWLLIVKRLDNVLLFTLLIIVGVLNREMTGFLILLSWLAVNWKQWRTGLVYCGVALTTLLAIRFSVDAPSTYTIAKIWGYNTDSWMTSGAILYNLMLLPFWIFLYTQRRKIDTEYHHLLLTLIPYVILLLTFAIWQEIRLWIPVWLALLPMIQVNESK